MNETAVTFNADDKELLGVIHHSKKMVDIAVLIIVGGPQYRVGSHRQFIQLARYLAENNVNCMRFDYTGMGDSEGNKKSFYNIHNDIHAAICCFKKELPFVKKIILWGLCDAASASLMYAYQDDRVNAIVLLNPWLKNEKAEGKTMVKHYYLQRVFSKIFWKKLFSGRINIIKSANEVGGHIQNSVVSHDQDETCYQSLMLNGINNFQGKVCLILSENDLTAKEFEQQAFRDQAWHKFKEKNIQTFRVLGADHTFSSSIFKREIEQITLAFINKNL